MSTEGIAHPMLETLNLSCKREREREEEREEERERERERERESDNNFFLIIIANKIKELNGLTRQNLPSLRSLDLHGNKLSSINSLHVPTLRQLFLASNSLTNIDGLGGLPQLTTLHLRNNQIALLDGFTSDLESLQYINLR